MMNNFLVIIGICIVMNVSLTLFIVTFIPYQHNSLEHKLDTSVGDKQNQEQMASAIYRLEGIAVRIHNDVQQILNHTNGTSNIIDMVPHTFP